MFAAIARTKLRVVRERRRRLREKEAEAKQQRVWDDWEGGWVNTKAGGPVDEDEAQEHVQIQMRLREARQARFEAIAQVAALAYNPDLAEVRGRDNHIYGGESTYFELRPGQEPRLTAIRLVDSFWFDQLILLAIGVNCVTMAMESPMDPEGTRKAHIIDVVGWVLLSLFTFECFVKILAYGLFAFKHSYLRDNWCRFDALVVALTWLPLVFPSFGQFSTVA